MANEHPSAYDDFQKFGHTGEYTTVWSVAGDTAEYFTGSKYGAGAVLREGGWDGNILLSNGGSISGSALTAGTIYPFSVRTVSGGSAGTAVLYVLRKNPKIN